jgi:hypothetical protein
VKLPHQLVGLYGEPAWGYLRGRVARLAGPRQRARETTPNRYLLFTFARHYPAMEPMSGARPSEHKYQRLSGDRRSR